MKLLLERFNGDLQTVRCPYLPALPSVAALGLIRFARPSGSQHVSAPPRNCCRCSGLARVSSACRRLCRRKARSGHSCCCVLLRSATAAGRRRHGCRARCGIAGLAAGATCGQRGGLYGANERPKVMTVPCVRDAFTCAVASQSPGGQS